MDFFVIMGGILIRPALRSVFGELQDEISDKRETDTDIQSNKPHVEYQLL